MSTIGGLISGLAPYLTVTEGIIAIGGVAYAGTRVLRRYISKTKDRLAILNHLRYFPPLSDWFRPARKSMRYLFLWGSLVPFLGIIILPIGLIFSAAYANTTVAPPPWYVIFFLMTQGLFAYVTYLTFRLKPLLNRMIAREEQRKAEAGLL